MTVLMYLSTPEEGGETTFPAAEGATAGDTEGLSECGRNVPLAYKPVKGDALLFYSLLPDGTEDKASLHGSCPTLKGVRHQSLGAGRVGGGFLKGSSWGAPACAAAKAVWLHRVPLRCLGHTAARALCPPAAWGAGAAWPLHTAPCAQGTAHGAAHGTGVTTMLLLARLLPPAPALQEKWSATIWMHVAAFRSRDEDGNVDVPPAPPKGPCDDDNEQCAEWAYFGGALRAGTRAGVAWLHCGGRGWHRAAARDGPDCSQGLPRGCCWRRAGRLGCAGGSARPSRRPRPPPPVLQSAPRTPGTCCRLAKPAATFAGTRRPRFTRRRL